MYILVLKIENPNCSLFWESDFEKLTKPLTFNFNKKRRREAQIRCRLDAENEEDSSRKNDNTLINYSDEELAAFKESLVTKNTKTVHQHRFDVYNPDIK